MATDELIHVTRWHNGEKTFSPFSDGEMSRRRDAMQSLMDEAGIDACLFTSYHNICYFSGFLYCKFGRRYGAVLNRDGVTTVSAAIDGGQPWRRSVGDNVTYTDWRRDSYFTALKELLGGVKRLG
ncbi:MAG TPA: creatininase, partial [Alphaproteobacteria bacterium]|nr:creatininase [Alphaproteobacteria bacterium]